MQVSVEVKEGLKRQIKVVVPADQVEKAISTGIFDGIVGHENEINHPEGTTLPPVGSDAYKRLIVTEAVGTDFAITFARNVYCTRVPVDKKTMNSALTR